MIAAALEYPPVAANAPTVGASPTVVEARQGLGGNQPETEVPPIRSIRGIVDI